MIPSVQRRTKAAWLRSSSAEPAQSVKAIVSAQVRLAAVKAESLFPEPT